MAPTITVHFRPGGGPLSALLRSGFANPGSYGLTLLEPGAKTIVQQWTTDFGTTAQNTHVLGAAPSQHGRVVDVIASIGLLDASKSYSLFLTVMQDGKELGTVSDSDKGTGLTKLVELIIMLSAAPVAAATASAAAVRRAGRSVRTRTERRAEVKRLAKKAIASATDKRKTSATGARKAAAKTKRARRVP